MGFYCSDLHATAYDDLDTIAEGKTIAVTVTGLDTIDINTVGAYYIKYDAVDQDNNNAAQVTRTVNVRDTLAPVTTLHGLRNVILYAGSSWAGADQGASCADACDTAAFSPTMTWGAEGALPTSGGLIQASTADTGTYHRTYTCTDGAGNSHFMTRKFTVIDKEQPVINILGAAIETYEASHDVQYTDKGASCQDSVDGDISRNVEVSGQVVNMAKVGTYSLRYDCQDDSGNQAVSDARTVVVVDTTCPVCSLNGAAVNYVEAGYKYVDADVSCTDDLDGLLSFTNTECTPVLNTVGCHWSDGNTVTDRKLFNAATSCKDIKATYANAVTGYYYITVVGDNEVAGSARRPVWCDMCASSDGETYLDIPTTVTPRSEVTFIDGVAQTHGSCAALGLTVAGTTAFTTAALARYPTYVPSASGTEASSTYLCTTDRTLTAESGLASFATLSMTNIDVTQAEQGKYIIHYHALDSAANSECVTLKRTVVVKDTMPPVISLHYNDAMAGMMAETQATGVNAWAFAAAASAVTGLAILAVGNKKTAATSVPV